MPSGKRQNDSLETDENQMPLRRKQTDTSANAEKETDPLRLLDSDCVSLIFENLDVYDLAHCEQVNRGWKAFADDWKAGPGFRLIFPDIWESEIKGTTDLERAAGLFNECANDYATNKRIISGKANFVTQYEVSQGFAISDGGEFVSWWEHDTVFWHRLGFCEDGSIYPVQSTRVVSPLTAIDSCIVIMPAACLRISRRSGSEVRQEMLCLETGKELWSSEFSEDSWEHNGREIAVGKTSFYRYEKRECWSIVTYDIRSGKQLYEVPSESHREFISRLIDVDGLETILLVLPSRTPVTSLHGVQSVQETDIRLIDPRGQRCVQRIMAEVLPYPEIWVPKDKPGQFAVMSYLETVRKVQKFALDADGKIYEKSIEAMECPDKLLRQQNIDPYRHIIVDDHGGPTISMVEPCPAIPLAEFSNGLAIQVAGWQWFCQGPEQRIRFTASHESQDFLLSFGWRNGWSSPHLSLKFVGKSKLSIYTGVALHCSRKTHYHMLDFGPVKSSSSGATVKEPLVSYEITYNQ
ncbi:hypothetical protein BJX99DRAFT_257254 [Aspergillus californicus]